MQKLTKKLSLVMVALMTVFTALSYMPAKAATVVPTVQFVGEQETEFTAGERITFNLNAANYGGRVQYRVVLWNDATKSSSDLWNTADRYYTNWMPYGNETLPLGWVINEPGSYRITIYAKRAGLANSKTALKGMNCDSYKDGIAFVVKPAAVTPEAIADVTVEQGATPVLPTEVTLKATDGTTKTAKVTWAAVDTSKVGTFVVEGTVEGTDVKAKVNVIVTAVTFEIKSVTALTNTKVKVALTEEINFVPDLSRFAIKGLDGKVLEVKSVALSLDNKAMILTTDAQTAYAAYTLTLDAVNKNFVGVPVDTTKSTASAAVDSYVSVKVTFDEVVDEVSATNIANYVIDNNLSVLKAELDATGKIVTLTTAAQTVGTIYNIVVQNVTDLAGNAMNKLDTYFGGMAKDTSYMTVSSATVEDYDAVKLAFAKEVNPATALNIANYVIDNNLVVLKAEVDEDDAKIVYLTTSEQVVGTIYKIAVNNVFDTLGNAMEKEYSTYFGGMAKDLSKPTSLVSVKDSNKITVVFDKKVAEATALNIANYAIDNSLVVLKAELATDGKTVTLTTTEQTVGTIYAITIQNVISAVGTAMDKTTSYFGGMSKDTQGPSYSVTSDVNKVVVLFNEEVDAASAVELTNYTFDGGLGYPTKAVLTTTGGNAKKEVTLTTGPQTGGKVYYVTVSNVKDANGNVISATNDANKKAFIGKATAAGTTVVKYLAASIVNNNTIDLIFDTELEDTDIAGLTVAIDKVTTTTNPGLDYVAMIQENAKVVRVQFQTTAAPISTNPVLFTQGVVYSATVSGVTALDAPVVVNNNNAKSYAGTNVANAIPAVKAVVPVDSTSLKVVFTEPVTGIVDGSFTVNGASITVNVASTDIVSEVLVYHTPTTQGTVYNLEVVAGAFRDAADLMDGKFVDASSVALKYAFAGTNVANIAPAIKAVVPVDKYNLQVVFTEPVNETDAEAATYTITNVTDATPLTLTGATYTLSTDGTKLSITLDSANDVLVQGKVYKVLTTSTIKDLSSLPMVVTAASTTNFAQFAGTNVANALPEIAGITINDTRTTLTVVFSEKIYGTLDATTLLVTAGNYTAGTAFTSATKESDGKTVTIVLAAPLTASQIATISATTAIKDINGQDAKTTAVQFGIQ